MQKYIRYTLAGLALSILSLTARPLLIEWSQTTPDSHLLPMHYQYWESYLPFDGVVIYVNHDDYKGIYGERQLYAVPEDGWALHSLVFSGKKLDFNNYKHAIDDLKDTPFKKFKHNFILMSWYSGRAMGKVFDWSNEGLWETTLHNIKIIARIAKQSGCKGVWFDTEQYASWAYTNYRKIAAAIPGTPAFKEYQKLIRKRGMEIMNAINEEFPGAELVLSFGSTLVYTDIIFGKFGTTVQNPSPSLRALLPALVDGLVFSAVDNGSTVTDGNEVSYYFKTEQQFKFGYDFTKRDAAQLSGNPVEYSKNIKAAFGLYPNSSSGIRSRLFSSSMLENSIYYAMKHTDKYVWTWAELRSFWVKPGTQAITPILPHPHHRASPTPTPTNALRLNARAVAPHFLQAIINAKARYMKDFPE